MVGTRTPARRAATAPSRSPRRRLRALAVRLRRAGDPRSAVHLATWIGAAALLILLASAAAPVPAHAFDVGEEVEKALRKILMPDLGGITGSVLQWLVEVPNYLETPGRIATLGNTTTAVAGASLAAISTLAVIHYWAAGTSLSGNSDPLQALPRVVGAGLFIAAWPWLFSQAVAMTNILSDAVLADHALGQLTGQLVVTTVATAGMALVIAAPVVLAVIVVFLAVMLTKLGLLAVLAALFAGVPIAVALWPVPSLAWISHFVLKLFGAILMIFLTWALLLATVSTLSGEFFPPPSGGSGGGGGSWFSQGAQTAGGAPPSTGSWIDNLAQPLVGLAVLLAMLSTSKQWLRVAGALPGGGGFVSHFVGWTVGHAAYSAIMRGLPNSIGGQRDSIARQTAIDAERAHDRAHGTPAQRAREAQSAQKSAQVSASKREADTIKAYQGEEQAAAKAAREQSDQAWREREATVTQPARAHASAESAEQHRDGLNEYRAWARTAGNDIGSVDSAYQDLRPDLQARVSDLVHGGQSFDRVQAGLAELRSSAPTSYEKHQIGELMKADEDTLGSTVPAAPWVNLGSGGGEPPRQPNAPEATQQAKPQPSAQPEQPSARPQQAPQPKSSAPDPPKQP